MLQVNFTYNTDSDEHDHSGHDHDHAGHDHDHDHAEDVALVTMVDQETGEEFEFEIADEFDFDGELYLVLLTTDEDPEAVFVRVVTQEDGTEALESLSDEDFDRVSDEYERLCELEEEEGDEEDEEEDDDDDSEEDEEDEDDTDSPANTEA